MMALAATSALAGEKMPPSEANWASRPSIEEYKAAFGKLATDGVFLRAVVHCAVGDSGELSGCRVVRETPAGAGVGAALQALTPKYRRKPPGQRDPREVNITYAWFNSDKAADWLRRPTPENLLAVFPTEAFRRGQDGRAIINCVVTVQGVLADCVTLEETPTGAGFGGAAIALTPQFLMRPAMQNGAPVSSVVTMPLNFITGGPGETFGARKVVTGPLGWSDAPTYSDVAAAYPAKARSEKVGGRATLACNMNEKGQLTNCSIATSEPKGYGFDIAAKGLAKQFAFPVRSDEDRKATHGLEIHLPIVFDAAMLEPTARVVGKPLWAILPTASQFSVAFKDVKAAGTARAMLGCTVEAGGALGDCAVVSETPAGQGIGVAALTLTPIFRLTTWSAEGLPVVGGAIRIPIRYEGEPAPPTQK